MSLMASFIILFDEANSMALRLYSSNDVGRYLKHDTPFIGEEGSEIPLSFLQNALNQFFGRRTTSRTGSQPLKSASTIMLMLGNRAVPC